MDNTVHDSAIKKLKLIFTVVDRPKGDFYLDVISQFQVNCQLVMGGKGTASSEIIELLGLNNAKAVILSVAREDQVSPILNTLEEKFHTVRNGSDTPAYEGSLRRKVFAIVDAGFAEDVMDIAREQGARGGTILNARGVANQEAAAFFGITLHTEKEILMMVVEKSIRDGVLNAIYQRMGMAGKAKGIAFSLPVSDVAGLATHEPEKHPE